jgi:putative MATE family efflux protein
MNLKSYIGDRAFYRRTMAIALPMIIQNTVTNLVNLLDNLMVSWVGTEQMSGVSIVNQFIFVFNLAVFGAISGAGIFTAQFNGRGDTVGVRNTMRIKLVLCLVIGLIGVFAIGTFQDGLINSFLHDNGGGALDLQLVYSSAKEYLVYIIIGLIPFAISQAYASTLRETGETFIPMVASSVSIVTNMVFNAILIFGLFGFPELGVAGAAIATALSRFIELAILVFWTHTHKQKCSYAVGLFRGFTIPFSLVKQVAFKGTPILCNELFWSLSITTINMCYSTRGTDVITAMNISFNLQNLLSVAYFALSSSIAIIVGNLLGAGKIEEAKETDKKLLAFAVFMGMIMMGIQMAMSTVFPSFYTDVERVIEIARYNMICFGITMPFAALATATYYTIRSGGRVFITMLFDSVYAWVVVIPVVASLAYFTSLPFEIMLPIVLVVENLKVIPGLILVHTGMWARQLKVE